MVAQLHCKSFYSFLEGASPPGDLIEQARQAGVRHLALTDRLGVYGAVDFCRRAEEASIHPVIGAEIPVEGEGRLVVLCRDAEGYASLCRELTRLHLDEDRTDGRALPPDGEAPVRSRSWEYIPDREADESAPPVPAAGPPVYADGSGLSPRQQWEPVHRISPVELALPLAAVRPALVRLAEKNWLLSSSPAVLSALLPETGPRSLAAELIITDRPADRPRNRALLELAKRHGLPAAATNDVHFARPEGHAVHRLLTAIRRRTVLGRLRPEDTAWAGAWLQGRPAMQRLFREIPEALANATAIAESCEFRFSTGGLLHPPFPLPPGETAYSLLWKAAFAGAARRFQPLTPAVIRQLEHELQVICSMGYAEYFLIVLDIVEFANREEIPTVGRGSAAGSLVAYCLGFTHVDPLALNLSFERFLNTSRTDPPDVDLDFCWRRRGRVIRYLYGRYGTENTAMLATHVTMAGRLAIRESARALGLPEAEISRFTRHIPHHHAAHLETVLRDIPECRNIPSGEEPYRTILRMAQSIAGYPRHLGLHPCGIVLSRRPLHTLVPLQMTASGLPAIQFDMHQAEAVGLLKIDILGQRSLSVISDCLAALREKHGVAVDFSRSPAGDAATWRTVQSGLTMGCFQIESPGMRSLLKKLTPRDMETIIAASSVIRPGPSDAGMLAEFIIRYHGRKPVTHLHPALEDVLGTTLGIMVYQEDILRVAHAVAGITPGEADKLRRAMSSKRSAEAMQAMRETFLDKAGQRGVEPETARCIWKQMETFSGYAFCKAHSASYAALSWQAAWLKTHYPAEFFAAVLSNGGGFYHAAAYILEARRWGLAVLLPDINRSAYPYTAEGKAVRTGLCQIKGLSRQSADRILTVRQERLFTSFSDFLDRTGLEPSDTERLILCGALDCFEFSRPELLWRLELQRPGGKGAAPRPLRRSPALPLTAGGPLFHDQPVPHLPGYTLAETIRQELASLEVCISDHPLALYEAELARLDRIRAVDLPRHKGRRVRLAGWLITSRRVFAKNRQYMKFLTLDDETGTFEVVLFPGVYGRWGHFTSGGGALVAEGVVTESFGSFTLEARRVLPLDRFPAPAGVSPIAEF